jgi:hypothetical protein
MSKSAIGSDSVVDIEDLEQDFLDLVKKFRSLQFPGNFHTTHTFYSKTNNELTF